MPANKEPFAPSPPPYGDLPRQQHFSQSSGRSRRSGMTRSIPYLWAAVIILLLLNLGLLIGLNMARLAAVEALGKVETMLDQLATEVVVYDVPINQSVPMRADVPFNQTMNIPLDTVISLDQTLSVPFGGTNIDLPIQTEVPIKTVVPVTLNEIIKVDTAVQLNTTIPVEVEVARTPLLGYLNQARFDIARVKSRLAFGSEPLPPLAPLNPAPTEGNAAPVTESEANTEVVTENEAGLETASEEIDAAAGAVQAEAVVETCSHPYWPLQNGATWTYNSEDTSFTQRVASVSETQVALNTSYEGEEIFFNLDCLPEQAGLSSLGDMRRLTEFGNLQFNNLEGAFLPEPAALTELGSSWTETYEVSGSVMGQRGSETVMGQITAGRAEAVYTPTGIETVETPLGAQEALRLEQQLTLELELKFAVGGEVIPAAETVSLTNIYWLAENVGLVKTEWQGGSIEQRVAEQEATQVELPALAADELVFVCLMLEGGAFECKNTPGISQATLTTPRETELAVPLIELPEQLDSGESEGQADTEPNQANEGTSDAPAPADSEPTATPDASADGEDTGDDNAALLQYAAAVSQLGQQISNAADPFQEAAIAYSNDQITTEEFEAAFNKFGPAVKGLIQQIARLSPPAEAASIHQKLVGGLAKCNKGVDMLDEWLDTFDDSLKVPATLQVALCIDESSAAQKELSELVASQN